jgi:hypothetical protein
VQALVISKLRCKWVNSSTFCTTGTGLINRICPCLEVMNRWTLTSAPKPVLSMALISDMSMSIRV